MNQVLATLSSPKARIPIVCVVGSVALLAGLVWAEVLDVQQTAVLVVAIYILSKVFMVGAALWVLWRHSDQLKRFFARFWSRD